MNRHNLLTGLILIGLLLGLVVGEVLYRIGADVGPDHWSKVLGDLILIRPLMLLIIPIVFTSEIGRAHV